MASFKEEFDEKKDKISAEIKETKEEIGEAVEKGIKTTKNFVKKLFLFALLAAIVAFGSYMLYSNWTYSDGTRTGFLIKISEKGYVFKTYEGQLNLGGFQTDEQSSIVGNTWNFSLQDDALYKKLEKLQGKKVMLRYKEKNKAMPWQGETNYFVYDVEEK